MNQGFSAETASFELIRRHLDLPAATALHVKFITPLIFFFDSSENNSSLWKSICNTSHSLMAPNPGIWQKDVSETRERVCSKHLVFLGILCVFSSSFRLACVLLITLVLLANEMRWRRITTAVATESYRSWGKLKAQYSVVDRLSWHGLKGESFNQRACAHARLGTGHKLNPLLEKQLTCSS